MSQNRTEFYERLEQTIISYLIQEPQLALSFADEIDPKIFYNPKFRQEFELIRLYPKKECFVSSKKLNDFEAKLLLLEKRLRADRSVGIVAMV